MTKLQKTNTLDLYVEVEGYQILHTIGVGSFGIVKLVKRFLDEKIYAMKILCKNELYKNRQVNHVIDEIKILKLLQTEFVVQFVETI